MIEYGNEDKENTCGYDCRQHPNQYCLELGIDGNVTQVDKVVSIKMKSVTCNLPTLPSYFYPIITHFLGAS